jgi:two-component system, OmpR family, response regulator BaeR
VTTDVVIVEDDPALADMLAHYLQANGFTAHVVCDGALALDVVTRIRPAAILLDVVLPNVDGIEVCARLRYVSSAPILIISARVEEIDRILGLEVGADDYVCKPFSPREVLARLRALLRRAGGRLEPDTALHGFVVDDAAQRIVWQHQPLPLTPLEYRLFRLLLSRPGQVLSRQRLLDAAHGDSSDTTDRAIDSHIKNLRRKLRAAGTSSRLIVSVYGAGYRFEAAPLVQPSSVFTSPINC